MKAADQLDLFAEPPVIYNPRYYKDLNIHERINVKANSLGFAIIYLYALRRGFNKVSIIRRDEHPEGIQWDKLYRSMRLNHVHYGTILANEKWKKNRIEKITF